MSISYEDLNKLAVLQRVDRECLRLEKQLADLPQRQAIAQIREKMSAIQQKADQVSKLKAKAKDKLAAIEREDAELAIKQQQIQEAIDAIQSDYRSVEARTKELNGHTKRRNTLAAEHDHATEELAKVEQVESQVAAALVSLRQKEDQELAAFTKEGSALKAKIEELAVERDEAKSHLKTALLDRYTATQKLTGAVALGKLEGDRCSVCRHTIEDGKLLELRSHAPLASCPNCRRLLIIE